MLTLLTTALALSSVLLPAVTAHPGEYHSDEHLSVHERVKRQHAANKRHAIAKRCEAHIQAFNEGRKKQRQNAGGSNGTRPESGPQNTQGAGSDTADQFVASSGSATSYTSLLEATASAAVVSTAAASTAASGDATSGNGTEPYYTSIQNATCVLAPEAVEGPYYIHNELIRQNLVENQGGVKLLMDIGVMDVTTCSPLVDALVDFWSANATGIYSGFIEASGDNTSTGNSGNTISDGPASGAGSSMGGAAPSGAGGAAGSAMAMPSGDAMPSGGLGNMTMGGSGAPSGGGGGGAATQATDQETFLRGAYPTNDDGVVEFTTVFPGFYEGRTIHIHTMVLTNWSQNANGTLGSEAGHVRHIGQIFFDEDLTQKVIAVEPYSTEVITRTTNAEDSIFATENTAGYNAIAAVEMLGDSVEEGLVAYITIGIDPTANYELSSTSYYVGNGSDE